MSVELARSEAGVGLLVMIGERSGHSWQLTFHRDDQWFRAYWNKDRIGWTLMVSALRVGFIFERWMWEKP